MRHVLLHLLFCAVIFAQPKVVAFGRDVPSEDMGWILTAISEGYAAKHGLKPTEAELEPLRKKFGPQSEATRRVIDFPMRIVQSWKLNRVWWGKHQGRLVLSAFGVHLATDGLMKEVEVMEKGGDVKFLDEGLRKKFFDYFEQYRGDGVVSGEKARKILEDGPAK